MRSVYPKLKNESLSEPVESLVFKVADTLRNSRGDKIINSSTVIKDFSKKYPKDCLMEMISFIEENKHDLSYKSELHPDRISWIGSIMKETVTWLQMSHAMSVSRFCFGISPKK